MSSRALAVNTRGRKFKGNPRRLAFFYLRARQFWQTCAVCIGTHTSPYSRHYSVEDDAWRQTFVTNLDGVPDGYRAMYERAAIKVFIEI
jgi:hypothetical protein